jgi:pimeloyl-ACP methyl ester carboxylesterase
LHRAGAEIAFDQRPVDAEISLDALWEREEMTLLGNLDAWDEQQRILAQEAAEIPRTERVRRYAAELLDITAGMGVDLRSYASRVAARSVVIHGSDDLIIPVESAQALAASIPDAEWRLVSGEGHQMLFTNPDVRQIVIRFVTQT